jgi:hypothetical protein
VGLRWLDDLNPFALRGKSHSPAVDRAVVLSQKLRIPAATALKFIRIDVVKAFTRQRHGAHPWVEIRNSASIILPVAVHECLAPSQIFSTGGRLVW